MKVIKKETTFFAIWITSMRELKHRHREEPAAHETLIHVGP